MGHWWIVGYTTSDGECSEMRRLQVAAIQGNGGLRGMGSSLQHFSPHHIVTKQWRKPIQQLIKNWKDKRTIRNWPKFLVCSASQNGGYGTTGLALWRGHSMVSSSLSLGTLLHSCTQQMGPTPCLWTPLLIGRSDSSTTCWDLLWPCQLSSQSSLQASLHLESSTWISSSGDRLILAC